MRYALAAALLSLLTTVAHGQQATCKLQAVEKKLTGPALQSFMRKCEDDVQTTCEQQASARRLEEPARGLFLNNCVKAFIG